MIPYYLTSLILTRDNQSENGRKRASTGYDLISFDEFLKTKRKGTKETVRSSTKKIGSLIKHETNSNINTTTDEDSLASSTRSKSPVIDLNTIKAIMASLSDTTNRTIESSGTTNLVKGKQSNEDNAESHESSYSNSKLPVSSPKSSTANSQPQPNPKAQNEQKKIVHNVIEHDDVIEEVDDIPAATKTSKDTILKKLQNIFYSMLISRLKVRWRLRRIHLLKLTPTYLPYQYKPSTSPFGNTGSRVLMTLFINNNGSVVPDGIHSLWDASKIKDATDLYSSLSSLLNILSMNTLGFVAGLFIESLRGFLGWEIFCGYVNVGMDEKLLDVELWDRLGEVFIIAVSHFCELAIKEKGCLISEDKWLEIALIGDQNNEILENVANRISDHIFHSSKNAKTLQPIVSTTIPLVYVAEVQALFHIKEAFYNLISRHDIIKIQKKSKFTFSELHSITTPASLAHWFTLIRCVVQAFYEGKNNLGSSLVNKLKEESMTDDNLDKQIIIMSLLSRSLLICGKVKASIHCADKDKVIGGISLRKNKQMETMETEKIW
ncbi:23306_t:CDS:2 [Dentiscutata erythropus]|uniref:23306_t:CDS:1 n=1 Tax=Dentiscutata erythropus TaxID=1348616 RepID=A0A9N9EGA5_9GLOM|nr:23306_t:CDS:2 [Dentiscutata erythropus]